MLVQIYMRCMYGGEKNRLGMFAISISVNEF
jgi:hypothetical protein